MTSFHEGLHPGAAILSEANGGRSRDNMYIAADTEFPPNTILKVGATPTDGCIPLVAGAAGPLAYAIYGAKTDATADPLTSIACITRDAELNRECIAWPDGFTDANKDAAALELAKTGIIVRGSKDTVIATSVAAAKAEGEDTGTETGGQTQPAA